MIEIATRQAAFQAGIVTDDTAILGSLRPSPRVATERLFNIYRHAYLARLQESLGQDFPGLKAMLGADRFGACVSDYLKAHPSRARSVRWVGAALPDYLDRCGEKLPAAMARFEWALLSAFDAPDETPLTVDALLAIPPDHWGGLRFRAIAAASHLVLPRVIPVDHQCLVHDRDFDCQGVPEEADWLIWRQDLQARFRFLAPDEAAAFRAMQAGATFADLCDEIDRMGEGGEAAFRAAAILQTWIASGLLAEIESPDLPLSPA